MAAYTTIDNPELYFQVKIWSGTGSDHAVTLDGDENMQPDLVWIKNRADAQDNILFDSVRGVNKSLRPDTTAAEDTTNNDGSLQSFDSDGFTLYQPGVGDDKTNDGADTYVAWCWKESATAGFDIVNNVKNDTDVENISHNLSAVPHWIIGKSRTGGSYSWICYHKDVGNEHSMYLHDTSAKVDSVTFFNDTSPTSSVFTLGADNAWNGTNIFYVWAPKQGFSRFSKFVGNGSSDGTYVHLGFSPAWVMIKGTNTNGWLVIDNKRTAYNSDSKFLYPHASDAEESLSDRFDFLSNGFKLRNTWTAFNSSGQEYIYMAFAEAPFVNSNGVPCNAR